ILARRHQLGMQALNEAYSAVKDAINRGGCRNPRAYYNSILTKKLNEGKERRKQRAQTQSFR
ncbi:MAG: hypothetical protein RL641_501, partial [Candidatus Parcubacteria bacterium]